MAHHGQSPLALIQPELVGRAGPLSAIVDAGFEVASLTWRGRPEDREALRRLDAQLAAGRPVAVFASIGAANFILRNCPALARHLSFRPESLRHHAWSALVPLEIQLNRSFVMLPFGHLADRQDQLRSLYGPRLFLRPDSACKTFPGRCVETRDLARTVSELRQLHALQPGDLVVVDRQRDIDPVEYRTWIARGQVITSAGYMFGPEGCPDGVTIPPCPRQILDLAAELTQRAPWLESIDELLVADFVLESGTPRLVELNAWSTSGFYPGADIVGIARAATDQTGS